MKRWRVTFVVSEHVEINGYVDADYSGAARVKALQQIITEHPRYEPEAREASRTGKVIAVELGSEEQKCTS